MRTKGRSRGLLRQSTARHGTSRPPLSIASRSTVKDCSAVRFPTTRIATRLQQTPYLLANDNGLGFKQGRVPMSPNSENPVNSSCERNRQTIADDLAQECDHVRRTQLLQELADYIWIHPSEVSRNDTSGYRAFAA